MASGYARAGGQGRCADDDPGPGLRLCAGRRHRGSPRFRAAAVADAAIRRTTARHFRLQRIDQLAMAGAGRQALLSYRPAGVDLADRTDRGRMTMRTSGEPGPVLVEVATPLLVQTRVRRPHAPQRPLRRQCRPDRLRSTAHGGAQRPLIYRRAGRPRQPRRQYAQLARDGRRRFSSPAAAAACCPMRDPTRVRVGFVLRHRRRRPEPHRARRSGSRPRLQVHAQRQRCRTPAAAAGQARAHRHFGRRARGQLSGPRRGLLRASKMSCRRCCAVVARSRWTERRNWPICTCRRRADRDEPIEHEPGLATAPRVSSASSSPRWPTPSAPTLSIRRTLDCTRR